MKDEDINQIDDNRNGPGINQTSAVPKPEPPFASNSLQLSPRELLLTAIIVSLVLYLAPVLWQRAEKFQPGPDYRIPLALSSDYWLYQRCARIASSQYQTLIIGDSVVWGHYVSKDNTLSAHLNKLTAPNSFANLGLDGTHPAALDGLIRYHAPDIKAKNLILHLNPLWMSSAKHDLQTDKEHSFNHPALVPQFTPKIPCYKAPYAARFSAVVNRRAAIFKWTSHLNIAYVQTHDPLATDIPAWTLNHPYKNPLAPITFTLPKSDNYDHSTKRPGAPAKTPVNWVDLETSLQWRFFKRSLKLLQQRNNKVFVLIGPFNDHILDAQSLDKYKKMKTQIQTWLRKNNIPHFAPPALPPEQYRDASHPSTKGYANLAAQLIKNDSFNSKILNPTAN